MISQMRMQENYINALDIRWSYNHAKKMEKICSNPKLGYRTSGSEAELKTGDMLAETMRKLGFPKVYKDAIKVDAWEFNKAELTFEDRHGKTRKVQLGAYQTHFVTEGGQNFTLAYVGKGTRQDYEGIDVKGKLVLVDINQRDEWWINFPVYQAHLKGAAAVIAVQTGGYGEVDDAALNAQDIAGPADAPAFSISRKDAEHIKHALGENKEITVTLDAVSKVEKDRTTYNIVGEIPGKHPERRIMLSAHYDSYFDGFQDDNTAIAMMLCIGKTLLQIGYQPENTLTFCAMAAEEWGISDTQFDWSTGAYEQVFTVHPEWRGSVIADLNFELPALAHGTRARIRSTHEYVPFLEEFLKDLPTLTRAYPEETRVTAPIETWSDDFSIAISGITYDKSIMTFTGFSDYEHIEDLTILPPTFDEEKMAIVIGLKNAAAFDGDICTLNFKINENALEGVTNIDASSVVKLKSAEIPSAVASGKVNIRLQTLGDIDGNDTVDIDDAVLLFQYSMLPELYPISYAGNLDFNKDGTVDIDDAVRLFQYSMLPDLYPLE